MRTLAQLLLFMVIFYVPDSRAQEIKIIVNVENPLTEITTNEIADYYFKKKKQWPSGAGVRFFDRSDNSSVRKIFLRKYLKRSQREVETFWIGQKLYTGYSAPTQVSSDYITSALVAKFPGAIGYVSKDFSGGKSVKVLEVKGE